MSEARTAWGWGLASVDAAGTTLDVWYPELTLGEAPAESDRPNHNFGTLAHTEADARGIRRVPVFAVSQLDEPIVNAADAYLKLHLMSMRMAKPNTLNLDASSLSSPMWCGPITARSPWRISRCARPTWNVPPPMRLSLLPLRRACRPQLLPPLSTCSVWISSRA